MLIQLQPPRVLVQTKLSDSVVHKPVANLLLSQACLSCQMCLLLGGRIRVVRVAAHPAVKQCFDSFREFMVL